MITISSNVDDISGNLTELRKIKIFPWWILVLFPFLKDISRLLTAACWCKWCQCKALQRIEWTDSKRRTRAPLSRNQSFRNRLKGWRLMVRETVRFAWMYRGVRRGGNRCRDNDVASFPMRTKLCSTGRKRIPLIKHHRSGPQCAFFVSTGRNVKGVREALIAMETENGSKVDADKARKEMEKVEKKDKEERERDRKIKRKRKRVGRERKGWKRSVFVPQCAGRHRQRFRVQRRD